MVMLAPQPIHSVFQQAYPTSPTYAPQQTLSPATIQKVAAVLCYLAQSANGSVNQNPVYNVNPLLGTMPSLGAGFYNQGVYNSGYNSQGWPGSHLLFYKAKVAKPDGSKGASVPITWKEKNGQIYGTAKVAKGSSLTDIPHGFILQKKGPNGWENVASAA